MKAVNYYIVVKAIKEDKKVGGLLITDTLDDECRYRDYQNSSNLAEQVKCSYLPGNACVAYGSQCPDDVFIAG